MFKVKDSLKRLIGRVKEMLKEYAIEVFLAFGVLAIGADFGLIPNLTPDIKWVGYMLFIIGFICIVMALINVQLKTKESRIEKFKAEQKADLKFIAEIQELKSIREDIVKSVNSLVNEIRKDREGRNEHRDTNNRNGQM